MGGVMPNINVPKGFFDITEYVMSSEGIKLYSRCAIENWLVTKLDRDSVIYDHGHFFIQGDSYKADYLCNKLRVEILKDKVLNTLSYNLRVQTCVFGNEHIKFSEVDLSRLYFELVNNYQDVQFFVDIDPTYYMYNRELDYIKQLIKK